MDGAVGIHPCKSLKRSVWKGYLGVCVALCLVLRSEATSLLKSCEKSCFSGTCTNGTCECDYGWVGDQCQHCQGRFKMLTFSNNVEPANGFLLRYLHRKAVEAHQGKERDSAHRQALLRLLDWVPQLWYHLHTFLEKYSTSDFLIGPCFFLSCPVSVAEFRPWFIDLWNHSIIPYLQEGAKDGIKVHGQKAVWEDPVEWVRGTLPWPNAQQDQSRLFHLPPPSVGPLSEEKKPPKDTPPPSTLESDPLMAMLLKLQESANYIESPEREGCLDPTLQATF